MRQVARRLRGGGIELIDVPDPSPGPGMVSVGLEASIISSGTERASLDVARKGLLAKARARPDQARGLLERARRDGIRSTVELVRTRLDELGPLGYSAAGTVLEAGPDARGLRPGQRVAIAGGGFATHSEIDVVPSLLCAPVPTGVSADDAAFGTLGAIALHGFRRSGADVGSTVAVIGLGLIGQLASRVARAAGCRVLGVDLEERLARLARACGAEAVERAALGDRWQSSADTVLICASTMESDPVTLAARLARDRGSVVVIGDVRMEVPRAPFYEKELDLRLSRSYGPGRYDPDYELHGHDYPLGYVRWTLRRNMEAFLGLVAGGKIKPSELITHRFALSEAERAFEALSERRPVAIQLTYPPARASSESVRRVRRGPRATRGGRGRRGPRFGVIGAGSFATATLIPGLLRAGLEPVAIASSRGLSAEGARRRFGFSAADGSAEELLSREDLDLVVIATRHDTHAELTSRALERGVPVYVEKPLALSSEELKRVRDAHRAAGAPLFVGFNRRHAPLAARIRELPGPRLMIFRVNAGRLDRGHWLNDLARGGGRLLGEGCHFVDFLCDQAPGDPISVAAGGFPSDPELPIAATDNFQLQIRFSDGSSGTVHYSADAPAGPGKERFETSAPGAYAVIEDFRRADVWDGRRRTSGSRRQEKGFTAQFASIASVLRGEADPPDADSFLVSTLTTLAALRALQTGEPEQVVLLEPDSRSEEPGAVLA